MTGLEVQIRAYLKPHMLKDSLVKTTENDQVSQYLHFLPEFRKLAQLAVE
jgi:hypothetical protein